MKNVLAIALTVILLSCTQKEGRRVDGVRQAGKDDFQVEFLFEKDGLHIYRFYDEGEARYFSIGNGKFLPQEQSRTVSNGRTTTTETWRDGVEKWRK